MLLFLLSHFLSVFFCSGQAGFNLEHAPYDGHTFVSLFNFMANHSVPIEFDETSKENSSNVMRADLGTLPQEVIEGLKQGREYLQQKQVLFGGK
jgi:hypothetical protein